MCFNSPLLFCSLAKLVAFQSFSATHFSGTNQIKLFALNLIVKGQKFKTNRDKNTEIDLTLYLHMYALFLTRLEQVAAPGLRRVHTSILVKNKSLCWKHTLKRLFGPKLLTLVTVYYLLQLCHSIWNDVVMKCFPVTLDLG